MMKLSPGAVIVTVMKLSPGAVIVTAMKFRGGTAREKFIEPYGEKNQLA